MGGNIYETQKRGRFFCQYQFSRYAGFVRRAALDAIDASIHYPEPGSKELRQILAKRENVSADQVICGNGAAELMFLLAQSLRPKHAVLAQPCFFEYEQSLQAVDCQITNVWLRAEDGFELTAEFVSQIPADADLVILGNPNNPTGRLIPEEVLAAVRAHCREHKIWLVADESFFDFLTEEDAAKTTEAALFEEETVFVIKSFTKMYAMPGLRVGYGICRNTALMEKNAASHAAVERVASGTDGSKVSCRREGICGQNRRNDSGQPRLDDRKTESLRLYGISVVYELSSFFRSGRAGGICGSTWISDSRLQQFPWAGNE